MSQETRQTELREKTQQLLQGPLKHVRAAALAAALLPLASVAATPAAAQTPTPCNSGGVCGVVYNDANDNGLLEAGETGIPNVKVTVCQLCDGTDTIEIYTDVNGEYSVFVPGGTYTLTVPIPPGTQPSPLNSDNAGVSNGLGSSVATFVEANGLPTDFGFSTPSNSCVLARGGDAFGLKSSAAYTVLGQSFANIVFGSGATLITGDVGVGPHDSGSLEKATINGTLFLDPTANPSIHGDLVATGGRVSRDLTAAVADADAANATNAARPATQGAATVGDVALTTITLAKPSGPNVVPVTSVNTHGVIAIVGDSTASVVFNVAAGFTCNGCSIVFAATTPGGKPILPQNVLWNFIGAGNDVSISKPVGSAQGIFLAPNRNLLLDKASLTGALIGAEGGLKLLVHSGAKLTCPQ
jgi:hypothetical protein